MASGEYRRVAWLLAAVVVSFVVAPLAFAVVGRTQMGEPRPVGSRCGFQRDPGSGWSDWGQVEHRGLLVPREACVHPPYPENREHVGLDPYLAAVIVPAVTFVVMIVAGEILSFTNLRATRAGRSFVEYWT